MTPEQKEALLVKAGLASESTVKFKGVWYPASIEDLMNLIDLVEQEVNHGNATHQNEIATPPVR